jgi:molybdenum cofactor guanylyltransferase
MTPAAPPGSWSVIVLTGGTGRRLGGRDKAGIRVLGIPFLDHLISALPEGIPIVVAGPERPVRRPVSFVSEEPPGAGPAAGIAAAMTAVSTRYVAVVAVDIPWAGPFVAELVAELASSEHDAVIPIDGTGRRQLLCSAWRTSSLRAALDRLGDPRDRAVRDLVAGSRIGERELSEEELSMLMDIDTPEDLERAQRPHPGPTLGGEAGTS